MKKMRIVLAAFAVFSAVTLSLAFNQVHATSTKWFKLHPNTGAIEGELPPIQSQEWACIASPHYCAAEYNLDGSGQPTGSPIQVRMGTFFWVP